MPYDHRSRKTGQIAYLHAVSNLKHTLSEQDLDYLYKQQPVGIDPKGRILIQQEKTIDARATDRSKALHLVSRELAKADWATGLSLKYTTAPSAHSSQFKKLLFLPRFLVTMTLPHRAVNDNQFSRRNGSHQLSMLAPRSIGLPYGSYARLILMYLTTKRVTSRERRFYLGESWRDFLKNMQMPWGGGPRGCFTAAQDQLQRLSATLYTIHIVGEERETISNVVVTDRWMRSADGVHVSLSESFYMLSGESVVPLETKIIHNLRRSPFTLDLYAWLTYRTSTTKKPTAIPWHLLELQFGADYTRPRDFRKKFRKSLEVLLKQKPLAPQVSLRPIGLHLEPASSYDVDWTRIFNLMFYIPTFQRPSASLFIGARAR